MRHSERMRLKYGPWTDKEKAEKEFRRSLFLAIEAKRITHQEAVKRLRQYKQADK